jgi:uncharacterized surface protein with fasciclin (FAS1) repeats
VGGVMMLPKKTITENAAASPVLHTLSQNLSSTDVDASLTDKGPFTVFAPTDDAFSKLPAGTNAYLLRDANEAELKRVLNYMVVPGKITSSKLKKMVKKGKGTATLTSVDGDPITVKAAGDVITLSDSKGDSAVILTADVKQKNGVLHVVDGVLMPN